MSHASWSKYETSQKIQEASEKKQLILKTRSDTFYTTNISHCELSVTHALSWK